MQAVNNYTLKTITYHCIHNYIISWQASKLNLKGQLIPKVKATFCTFTFETECQHCKSGSHWIRIWCISARISIWVTFLRILSTRIIEPSSKDYTNHRQFDVRRQVHVHPYTNIYEARHLSTWSWNLNNVHFDHGHCPEVNLFAYSVYTGIW